MLLLAVISLAQVSKANVHRMVILPCFLLLAETTLILMQQNLTSGLDPVQKNTSEHLTGDASEGNDFVVVVF